MVVTEEDMVERFDPTKTDMDDYWTMEDDSAHKIDLIDDKMDYNDLFENVDFIALKTSKVETFEIQAICELDLNYNAVLDLGADVSGAHEHGQLGQEQGGLSAIFQDLAASAPSSIAALNTVIAFSMIEGNICSTSDCARAYIQSALGAKHRTFVMLPPELAPEPKKHVHMPCAQLYKSLYGHPESSAHWQAHLSRILREKLNGVEFSEMPSVFRFGRSLVMSVYVDDLTLSGKASRTRRVLENPQAVYKFRSAVRIWKSLRTKP